MTNMPLESFVLFYLLFAVSLLTVAMNFKKIRAHDKILLCALAVLAAMQMRNVPIFVLYVIPWISGQWIEFPRMSSFWSRLNSTALATFFLFLLPVMIWRISTGAYYYLWDERALKPGPGLAFSNATEQFVRDHTTNQRILNDINTGHWLLWETKRPVYINANLELTGRKFFREYVESTSPGRLQPLLKRYDPQIIVYDYYNSASWTLDLMENPDWRLATWDSRTACWLRRDVKILQDSIVLPKNIPPMPSETETWSILRQRPPLFLTRWMSGFIETVGEPWNFLSIGHFALLVGRYEIAERCFLAFYRQTGASTQEVLAQLGYVYYFTRQWDKAVYCLSRFLDVHPEDKDAERILDKVLNLKKQVEK